jgi:hypothetical protein
MISNFFTSPIGVFVIVVLLLVAFYVAIGATPGENPWRFRLRRKDKTPPASEPTTQTEETPPATPPQEPKPAPPKQEPKPAPEVKIEPPCAEERREIERLTLENEELKRPKVLTETDLLTLMDDFRRVNQTAASMLTSEARKAEHDAIKVHDHLEKLAVFLESSGYGQHSPNELMKLLWSANKAHRDNQT